MRGDYLLALYKIEEMRKLRKKIATEVAKRSLYERSIIRHGLQRER